MAPACGLWFNLSKRKQFSSEIRNQQSEWCVAGDYMSKSSRFVVSHEHKLINLDASSDGNSTRPEIDFWKVVGYETCSLSVRRRSIKISCESSRDHRLLKLWKSSFYCIFAARLISLRRQSFHIYLRRVHASGWRARIAIINSFLLFQRFPFEIESEIYRRRASITRQKLS